MTSTEYKKHEDDLQTDMMKWRKKMNKLDAELIILLQREEQLKSMEKSVWPR